MDARHLHQHLKDLSGRQHFLRTLRPDSDRYKLWLGDVVELINVAYGVDSVEMAELRAALTGGSRPPAEAADAERERVYLARLDALAALLGRLEGNVRDPITFFPDGH